MNVSLYWQDSLFAGVIDTGEQFIGGVVDTGDRPFGYFWPVSTTPGKNIIAGVIDTGDKH